MNKGMNMTATYTYDVDSFSDLYKEATGIRPTSFYYKWMDSATPAELQQEWDYLCNTANMRARADQQYGTGSPIPPDVLRQWSSLTTHSSSCPDDAHRRPCAGRRRSECRR